MKQFEIVNSLVKVIKATHRCTECGCRKGPMVGDILFSYIQVRGLFHSSVVKLSLYDFFPTPTKTFRQMSGGHFCAFWKFPDIIGHPQTHAVTSVIHTGPHTWKDVIYH